MERGLGLVGFRVKDKPVQEHFEGCREAQRFHSVQLEFDQSHFCLHYNCLLLFQSLQVQALRSALPEEHLEQSSWTACCSASGWCTDRPNR